MPVWRLLAVLPLLLAFFVTCQRSPTPHNAVWHGESFSVVVLPDTQIASQRKPELITAQTQWIVANRLRHNIRFVVHVGDIVEWPTNVVEWEAAKAAMTLLDGEVPYVVAIGNHDMDGWPKWTDKSNNSNASRSTSIFNSYFPLEKYASLPTFAGSFPSDLNDNSCHLFTAGGADWMIVTLKYDPTDAELAWASALVSAHPRRQVIINTHNYMDVLGRSAAGERIWAALGRRHPNVAFILSGHFSGVAYRADKGDGGNTVHQLMADYQSYDRSNIDESSYLRILTFDPRSRRVEITTYSPYLDSFKLDSSNHFALNEITFSRNRAAG